MEEGEGSAQKIEQRMELCAKNGIEDKIVCKKWNRGWNCAQKMEQRIKLCAKNGIEDKIVCKICRV